MNSDLNPLLDEINPVPAPSADELRTIIGRARSRTRRLVSVGLVLAVVAAAGVAVAVSPGSDNTRVVTGPLGPAALAVAVSASSPSTPSGQPPPITFSPLFFRTTNDKITIRAHLGTITGPLPCPPNQDCPAHLPHTIVHVGLANDEVVGEMAVPGDGPRPPILALVGPTGFGLPGAVTGLALVFRAGSVVARVRLTFADGGSDEMAPVDGWVVLAHLGSSPVGTVEALDSTGRVLGSSSMPPAPPSATGPAPGHQQGSASTSGSPAHQTEG
jgi:hypothetical protein